MIKLIAIVAGEPDSINSEIIVKAWKKIKNKKNFFIIGDFLLLKKQINKIRLKIQLVKINSIDEIKSIKKLNILNVPLKNRSLFKNNLINTRNYVFNSLDLAHKLSLEKKIKGFINAPIDKTIFKNKFLGVTEYLGNKQKTKNKEIMMIYNKKLSVVPLTTHLEIKNVTSKINSKLLESKINTLNESYYRLFNIKPKIAILGLNPHNSENRKNSIENKIIRPVIEKLKNCLMMLEKGKCPVSIKYIVNNAVAILPLGKEWRISPTDKAFEQLSTLVKDLAKVRICYT